jgi:hypothetical protein
MDFGSGFGLVSMIPKYGLFASCCLIQAGRELFMTELGTCKPRACCFQVAAN